MIFEVFLLRPIWTCRRIIFDYELIYIEDGEFVFIVGASGAGKSTLLQILGTLSTPDTGSLVIDGVDVLKLKGDALSEFRNRRIGFVFQFHHLLLTPVQLHQKLLGCMLQCIL